MTRARVLAVASTLALLPLLGVPGSARATWSIVAVDPETREVGVAGASCFAGVAAIAGIAPGRGAVAAQALANFDSRDRAVTRLARGDGPRAILDEISSDDWDPSPWHRLGGSKARQYAIVALPAGLRGAPRHATFTGDRTYRWAGTRSAPGVVVAGNMLVSAQVVEAALARFHAPGPGCRPDLADRLLAALVAGAEAGGDRRCARPLSALSAFLSVAHPDDPPGAPSIQVNVPYHGPSELLFFPIRGFWPKRGGVERNPVHELARRHLRARPGSCIEPPPPLGRR